MDREQILKIVEREGFPVFRETIRFILSLDDSIQSIPKLAEHIIRDPGMSARLIQTANSVYFNPSLGRVRTVTRAVVLLGLRNVATLAVSLAMVDDLVGRRSRGKHLWATLLRSINRAILAKNLARASYHDNLEEVYLAALLYEIGEIALELFVDDATLVHIEERSKKEGKPIEVVRKEVLGASAREFTLEINKRWGLSTLLDATLSGVPLSKGALYVRGADQLRRATYFQRIYGGVCPTGEGDEEEGQELRDAVAQVVQLFQLSTSVAEKILKESRKELTDLMRVYRSFFANVLGDEGDVGRLGEESGYGEALTIASESERVPQDGHRLPLEPVLKDLRRFIGMANDVVTMLQRGGEDPHLLLSLVMEAVYSGIGMDVVLCFVLSKDRQSCTLRYSLVRPGVRAIFVPETIALRDDERPHIFTLLRTASDPLWITERCDDNLREAARHHLVSSFLSIPCVIAPIAPKGRTVGFIYADRRTDPSTMTDDAFTGFQLLSRLASVGFHLLALKR